MGDRTEDAVELLGRGVVLQHAQRLQRGSPVEGRESRGVRLEGRARGQRYKNGREEKVDNPAVSFQEVLGMGAIRSEGASNARQCPKGANNDVQVDSGELVRRGGVIQVLEEGSEA